MIYGKPCVCTSQTKPCTDCNEFGIISQVTDKKQSIPREQICLTCFGAGTILASTTPCLLCSGNLILPRTDGLSPIEDETSIADLLFTREGSDAIMRVRQFENKIRIPSSVESSKEFRVYTNPPPRSIIRGGGWEQKNTKQRGDLHIFVMNHPHLRPKLLR